MTTHPLKAALPRLRSAVRRLAGRALVLLYHRVTEVTLDPQWLCVKPQQFAEHLEILRRYYHPMSLSEMRWRLRWAVLPRNAVVVTFDDGYADNLHEAKPLLERFDVPASVFVVSDKIAEAREFWWDELERILLGPRPLPPSLSVTINGQTYSWELREFSDNVPGQSANHTPQSQIGRWNVTLKICPTPSHMVYVELTSLVKDLEDEARERVFVQLAEWAGTPRTARATHRVLDEDDILELSEGGLVDIGAHAVTHPVLASQSLERQRAEIVEGKRRLEAILGRPVTAFAYPFGTRGDYTAETVALVRQAGFTCACSNFAGSVQRRTDVFQLPRNLVRDWDGDQFARRLRELQSE